MQLPTRGPLLFPFLHPQECNDRKACDLEARVALRRLFRRRDAHLFDDAEVLLVAAPCFSAIERRREEGLDGGLTRQCTCRSAFAATFSHTLMLP